MSGDYKEKVATRRYKAPRRFAPPLREKAGNGPKETSKTFVLEARFMSAYSLLLAAFFALAPTAVLAQQNNASQGQNQQNHDQPEAVFVKTEAAPPPAEPAQGQTEDTPAKTQDDGKLISVPGGKALGMSILGNQEAPKALVIVPWKSSELGNVLGISTMLDDSKQPIDKEVFMRMLSYYEIRSETAHPAGAPTERNAAQPKAAMQSTTQRRK